MKTLITTIALALTATTAIAHQPDTTTASEFKRGYCSELIHNADESIVSNKESLRTYDIEDYLDLPYSEEFIDGLDEGKGKIKFGNPTREDIVGCLDYIRGLGKAKWDLHNK
jgi:hypothetical protein